MQIPEVLPNQEQQNQDLPNTFLNRISSKDITKIMSVLIPSAIFLSASLVTIFTTEAFCHVSFSLIIKGMSILYSLWISLCIINLLLVHFDVYSLKPAKVSITVTSVLIDLLYMTFVCLSFYIYSMRPSNCFDINIVPTSLIFTFILIGFSHISNYVLKGILIVFSFPVLVFYFLRNPNSFFSNFGIDPEILKKLPTISADHEHCSNCVICSEDIKEGDDIFILKCPGKHYFHSNCIKDWLAVKIICPMCRSENVL